MKHIKYLDMFRICESKDLYSEIDRTEHETMMTDFLPSDFTVYEKSRLKEEFDKWEERFEISYKLGLGNKVYLRFGGRIFGREINIVKLEDGWYLLDIIPSDVQRISSKNHKPIEHFRKFYKCDQFDGLLHFLNDKMSEMIRLR
jgi:hypothetical protein